MTAHAAVGVDDDLAAGEPGVAVGATDDEAARRVDEDFGVLVDERSAGITFSMMSERTMSTICLCLTSGACWVETTMADAWTGTSSSYSMVTCVLPSGRSQSTFFALANLSEAARQLVRVADWGRHEVARLVGGDSRTSAPGRRRLAP